MARLQHLFWRTGQSMRPNIIEYGPLMLNLETYQAAVAGRVLDLTYMEYELLRFLAGHPAKVFTRETLLSRVWGYEYYGGRAHGGRAHPALPRQARRRARPPDPDGPIGGVPLRPGGVAPRRVTPRHGQQHVRRADNAGGRALDERALESVHRRVGPGFDLDPAPSGRAATATAERVGRFSVKYSTQTSLTAANSDISRRYTVVFTTSASVASSPESAAATLSSACRSWLGVPPSTVAARPMHRWRSRPDPR